MRLFPSVAIPLFCLTTIPAFAQNGPSVEELHRIAKERAEKILKEASGPVSALMAQLEIPYDQDRSRIDTTIAEILKYKDLGVRALVQGLFAPAGAPRGENSARALARTTEAAVITEIELKVNTAPSEARRRMAWVLGRHAGERVIVILQKLLADPDMSVASSAALSLGRLKHKESAFAIAEKLDKAPGWLGRSLLTALGDLEEPRVHPQIIAFLETPAATECVSAAAWAVKGIPARELLVPGLKLLLKWKGTPEDDLLLAQAVAAHVTVADRDALVLMRRVLTEISAPRPVQEECAYALHFAKDANAKTWLLQDVNDKLKDNPDSEKLLRERAKIYLRLKIHISAQKDYESIRRLAKNRQNNINLDGAFWIEFARSYAGTKTYQNAADCLRNAITLDTKSAAFKDYEEFAEMKKQAKFVALFENND
ncbi:MAG: HEAT repeat domain-containing protein [Planctomycetota bacterium]